MELNTISGAVVDAAMKVHTALGPGLLEHAYQACLAHELRRRGLRVRTEVPLPVIYEGMRVKLAYRLDLLVEERVIVETKAVASLLDVHRAQLLSHLRLSGHTLGLLINFHERHLKNGIVRLLNGYQQPPP